MNKCDCVLFVERTGELRHDARLNAIRHGVEAKASLKRA
jgi:hypothetical protein